MAIAVYPQTQFLDDVGRPSRVWQQYFTNLQSELLALQTQVNALFATTLPSAPLPAQPDGYIVLTIGGRQAKVPFYYT